MRWAVFFAFSFANLANAQDISGVGRIEYKSGGTCSAVLIAPDIIATAAHCVRKSASSVFRPSDKRGGRLFPVEQFLQHPLYDTSARIEWQYRFDIAVGKLAEPVPTARAQPLPLGEDAEIGEKLFIVSWRGADDRLRQRACPVITGIPGLVTLGCEVRGGESGAPVLRKTSDGLEVIAIISSRTRLLEQPVAQASNVRLRIPPLLKELAAP
ncbi:MAG: trypsin-like serine protease [Pseudomonadota bacterium]